jgi:DNA-binding NarL/FixJ family response regulator
MRESFAAVLNKMPGLRCGATYATAEEALRDLPKEAPDVALVDIHLPEMDGIECVARLKALLPELRILMLTRYEQRDTIFNSLRAGANGYVLKSAPLAELVQAIEQVHAGGSPMTMQIARKVVEYFHEAEASVSDLDRLTPRESEVLKLLARGFRYQEIADSLGNSISTVRAHVHAIYRKLHVNSRGRAIAKFTGGVAR